MRKALSFFCIGILWVIAQQASAARDRSRRCPPIEIENGRTRIKSRGRVAKFRCRKGYTKFEGDRFATCVRGKWNGKIPKCITTGCEYYDTIPNGEAVYLYNDALLQILCNPGYVLEGSNTLTCDGYSWNDTIPACKAPKNSAMSCDFEETSICGWMNGENDEFEWMRNQGPSSDFGAGTGPQVDHTLGTVLGHYMYIEGSTPRTDGDRARLFSPVYQGYLTDTAACFAFYYHMYGNTTGHLNIYIKGANQDIEYIAPAYQMTGYTHDDWILHVIHLNKMDTDFQVVIEGMRGHDFMSDIGIDDVKLAQGDTCDQMDDEVLKQFITFAPLTTTVMPTTAETEMATETTEALGTDTTEASETESETTEAIETASVNVTSANVTVSLVTGSTSPSNVTVAPLVTISPADVQTVQSIGNVTSTAASLSTIQSVTVGSEEDLTSCRDRCGEIAVESGVCGCDIECGNLHTCCLDVEHFCHVYLSPPTPETSSPPTPVILIDTTTSAQPLSSASTVRLTEAFTTPQLTSVNATMITTAISDKTTTPVVTMTTVAAGEVVTETTISTTAKVEETTQTDEMTTKVFPSASPSPSPSSSSEPDTTTLKTTEAETSSTTTTTTTTVRTAQPTTAKSTTVSIVTTTEVSTPTEKETTFAAKATTLQPVEREGTTTSKASSISTVPNQKSASTSATDDAPATTVAPETTEGQTSSSPQAGVQASSAAPSTTGTASEKPKGLSRTSIYVIAITSVMILIIVAILIVAYIRKRRRDKLPEDSDIRFLARDEIMMEGNVFSLTGTLTHARNSAI